MSLAKLGIEVTSSGAAKATNELKALTGAAEMAENAALGVASGAKQMADQAVNASKGVTASARASRVASSEMSEMAAKIAQTERALSAQATAEKAASRSAKELASATSRVEAASSGAVKGAAQMASGASASAKTVDSAAKSLGVYIDAQGRLREASGRFVTDARKAQLAAMNVADALDDQSAAAIRAAQATAVANDNIRSFSGSSGVAAASAAQFQDTVVTATAGMNPLVIGLQQGTQWAGQLQMAMQGGATFTEILAGTIRGIFSPLSLLAIGLISAVAAGIQLVDWANVASRSLGAIADFLDEAYDELLVFTGGLALAFSPAIIASVRTLTIAVGTGLVGAFKALSAAILSNPLVAFGVVLAGAITAAYIFRDELTKILGVDLFGVAKTFGNYFIATVISAFEIAKFTFLNFPFIIGEAMIGAVNVVILGVDKMVTQVMDGINRVIEIANNIPGVEIATVDTSEGMIPTIPNIYSEKLKGARTFTRERIDELFGSDFIGGGVDAIGMGVDAVTDKLRSLGDAALSSGKGAEKAAKAFKGIVSSAEATIASLQAEKGAIGLSDYAATRLIETQNLLNQAKQQGIILSDDQKGKLVGLAGQITALKVATDKAKDAFQFAKDATKGFFSDMISGLRQGESVWQSFGKAAQNVLNKIIDKMLNQLIDAIFQVNSAVGSGGGSGFLGSIFGSLFGGPSAAGLQAASAAMPVMYAKGGAFTNSVVSEPTPFSFGSGQLGIMGENEPEAVMPLKRGPDGRLGVEMHGGGRGGAQQVHVTAEVYVNDNGNFDAKVVSIADQRVATGAPKYAAAAVKQANKGLPGRVAEINRRSY
ncbi:hypothetical protein [Pseudovibrio sp. POLY-S9]|uniref:hypothetical protein n=1 Tax=Pseudovibrio sp. POLY-S9 TaxID=1576596 RepID=UPI000709B8EB|nr:hypothetical protein [Pseudovibrio sp. POLY-S9]